MMVCKVLYDSPGCVCFCVGANHRAEQAVHKTLSNSAVHPASINWHPPYATTCQMLNGFFDSSFDDEQHSSIEMRNLLHR